MAWELPGNSATNPPTDFLGTTDTQPLVFKTNNIEQVRLDVSGNLGIGTTNPEARLHIHSPDNNALKVTNTAVGKTLRIGVDQLGSWLEPTEQNSSIRLNANPTLVGLLIDGQTGNVGIGTRTPHKKLSVNGAIETSYEGIYFGGMFGVGGADYYYGIGARISDSLVYDTFQYHRWRVGSDEKMTLDGSGNLGIGTTSPNFPLHVVNTSGDAIGSSAVYGKNTNTLDDVRNYIPVSTNRGVTGESASGTGVVGISNLAGVQLVDGSFAGGAGVVGSNDQFLGRGVVGQANGEGGTGVEGTSSSGTGVNGGTLGSGAGVSGSCFGGGNGVFGTSSAGYGGEFDGGRAPLRLAQSGIQGHPTDPGHQAGELFVDKAGSLYYYNGVAWKGVALV